MIVSNLEELKPEDLNKVQFDGKWVHLSETGVTWYGNTGNINHEIHIPECSLYCNVNGKNVTLLAPIQNKKILFDCWFMGTIRERFVEPKVDNLTEMKEWFEEYSSPHTIAIGFEQWLPDQKVLTPTYYAIKMDTADIYDKWLQYMIVKSLESKGDMQNGKQN